MYKNWETHLKVIKFHNLEKSLTDNPNIDQHVWREVWARSSGARMTVHRTRGLVWWAGTQWLGFAYLGIGHGCQRQRQSMASKLIYIIYLIVRIQFITYIA
jgi:hypothetical protein